MKNYLNVKICYVLVPQWFNRWRHMCVPSELIRYVPVGFHCEFPCGMFCFESREWDIPVLCIGILAWACFTWLWNLSLKPSSCLNDLSALTKGRFTSPYNVIKCKCYCSSRISGSVARLKRLNSTNLQIALTSLLTYLFIHLSPWPGNVQACNH